MTAAELREVQAYTDLSPASDPDMTDEESNRLRAEREKEKRGGSSGGSKGPAKARDEVGEILSEIYAMVSAKAA